MMQLAERIFVKENPAMADLCRKQTIVYNQALWYTRQEYFNNDDAGEGFLSYFDLNDKAMLKWHDCYREAIPGCAANTIRRCANAMKAYWAALKTYRKSPAGFTGAPKMPNYVQKGERSEVDFTYAEFVIRDHHVIFPAATGFPPLYVARLADQKRSDSSALVKQVRVVPAINGYWVECVHDVEEKQADVDKARVLAMDLGMHYIATVVDNLGTQPEAISGAPAKQINQWYAKELARLKAEKERCTPRMAELQRKKETGLTDDEWREFRGLMKDTPQMRTVVEKRNRRIDAYFHKVSKYIVALAIQRRCGTIVVGHNKGQKQNIDIGHRTNQTFTMLPIFKMINQIIYKAALVGIEVLEVTEEYTSKASCRDHDDLPDRKHVPKKANGHSDITFSGTRVHRGLYRDGNGKEIHADVNAAYNIMRKACPEAFGLKGAAIRPWPVVVNMTCH